MFTCPQCKDKVIRLYMKLCEDCFLSNDFEDTKLEEVVTSIDTMFDNVEVYDDNLINMDDSFMRMMARGE